MTTLGVIPARYASTRFPGKPLIMIDGKTMIRRVYEQSLKCKSLNKVIVATDHQAIQNQVASFGGEVIMTHETHHSGTERCAEVVEILEEKGTSFDVVINIQGDEPFIHPEQISQLTDCFTDPEVQIATLIRRITDREDLKNPNLVKVVKDIKNWALYFSRSPIPYTRGSEEQSWLNAITYFKHIGIYGYRAAVLKKLIFLAPTPLEQAESLEQLRWLENGFRIFTQETEFESISIDSPSDLLKITNRS